MAEETDKNQKKEETLASAEASPSIENTTSVEISTDKPAEALTEAKAAESEIEDATEEILEESVDSGEFNLDAVTPEQKTQEEVAVEDEEKPYVGESPASVTDVTKEIAEAEKEAMEKEESDFAEDSASSRSDRDSADRRAAPDEGSKKTAKKGPKSQNPSVKKPVAPKKGGISPKKILFGFLGMGVILVMIFYGVLLWGLLSGNVENPLFASLGIESGDLKEVLLLVTNSIFGMAALIFLFASLVRFFQWIMMGPNAVNRKPTIVKAGINVLIFFLMCGLWVGFYWLISNAGATKTFKEDESMIRTEPAIVIGLTSPIKVEFDIGTNLFPQINQSLIRQINWDFDSDGTIDASGPKVVHRFIDKGTNNGRFLVRAEVLYLSPATGKEERFTSVREVIIANEGVIPSFTADPESGPVPLKVKFDAFHSKDPDGEVILYEWDLDGDGEFEVINEEDPTAEKEFFKIGEFKVALRATGTNNDSAVAEKTITVTEPEETLRAEISSLQEFRGEAPYKITLDGTTSFSKIGKIIRFEWRVDDEEKVFVGRKFQRTFRKPGDYEVTLTVENEGGEKAQTSEIIKTYKRKKDGDVLIKTTPSYNKKTNTLTGENPLEVTFDASLSVIEDPVEWKWDFEDDGIFDETGETVKYNFREIGEYDVKLVIIDSDEDEYEIFLKVIVIPPRTKAKVVATPPAGPVPLKVTFDGSGSYTEDGKIIDYVWELPGTDPVHYGAKITYEILNVGIFPVRLTILTDTGKTATTEILISARAEGVNADFNFNPKGGAAPLRVQYNPTASTGTISQYFWDFGDGSVSTQFLPEHVYEKPGEYEILLKIKDPNGVVSEMKKKIKVTEKKLFK